MTDIKDTRDNGPLRKSGGHDFDSAWMKKRMDPHHTAWLTTNGKITPLHFETGWKTLPNAPALPDEATLQTLADIYNRGMLTAALSPGANHQTYEIFAKKMTEFEGKLRANENLPDEQKWQTLPLDASQRANFATICTEFRENWVLNHFKTSYTFAAAAQGR